VAMFTTANPEVEINNRDKIKYLKRYITLDREIEHKLREIDHWRAKLTRIMPIYSTEPKGGGSIRGKTESIIAKIVDLENEIDADIDRLVAVRDGIKAIIEAVEDDRERLLLQYRYLDGKTFEKIAVEMHYSWRQIHRLHSKALTNLKMS
jgi:DNA-directed RNA polymerase specialized sigma subunit